MGCAAWPEWSGMVLDGVMGWVDLGFTVGTDEDICTDVGLDSGEESLTT